MISNSFVLTKCCTYTTSHLPRRPHHLSWDVQSCKWHSVPLTWFHKHLRQGHPTRMSAPGCDMLRPFDVGQFDVATWRQDLNRSVKLHPEWYCLSTAMNVCNAAPDSSPRGGKHGFRFF